MVNKFTSKRAVAGVLANALNLLDEAYPQHHQRTAYLAYRMALELGYEEKDRIEMIWDALLYNVGSVILPDGLKSIGYGAFYHFVCVCF